MRRSILALGEPMAGKSTALKKFRENFLFYTHYISTGELMRNFVRDYPEHELTINELNPMFAGGKLASDSTTAYVFEKHIEDNNLSSDRLFLLDGVIRKLTQVNFEEELNLDVLSVLYFDTSSMPDDELVRRAELRGREEETPEIVRARREIYREKTAPLVECYSKRGLLRIVDAYQSESAELNKIKVYDDVERLLLPLLK